MKAVNLIPADARRAGVKRSGSFGPGALLLVGLVVVLGFVTVLVLTDNTISSREARLQTLRAELSSQEQVASRLGSYERFSSLAQARAATVRSIAGTRFDWHAALSDLARVVPKTTTLQSLTATVSPSASTGAASAGGSGLRSIIAGPAFEMTGCSATQDDVAQLMSSLRTMDGVQRVTLSSSTKSPSTGGSSSGSSSSTASGCANGPSFHLIVFFTPLPTTAPAANGSVTPQQVSSTATSGSAG